MQRGMATIVPDHIYVSMTYNRRESGRLQGTEGSDDGDVTKTA
jgi:hypothetical protein